MVPNSKPMQTQYLPAQFSSREKINKFVRKTAKAIFLVVFVLAVFLLINNNTASAQDIFGVKPMEEAGLPSGSLIVIIAKIINGFIMLLGLVAVIIVLYGGVLWMTAQGREEQVLKAKKTLINGVIGLIIIILSYVIVRLFFNILGLAGVFGPGGPGGPGGPRGEDGEGTGALGAGIIQSHYPARNATNVPRNTNIAITFKEPICVGDPANGALIDNNGTPADLTDDKINPAVFKLYPAPGIGDPAPLAADKITVAYSQDKKNFIFDPVDYLGNPNTPTVYFVELTYQMTKGNCATKAFGSLRGYTWKFTVSTFLDLTPPQIDKIYPQAYADPATKPFVRNTKILIEFTEAMDPLTLSDKQEIQGGGSSGSAYTQATKQIITVKANADFLAGDWYFGNQYRTVAFTTTEPCGLNSCGQSVYCLPGMSEINVLAKAATLKSSDKPEALPDPDLMNLKGTLYDGLVDMCGNSLDGNKNGTAQGPTPDGSEVYSLNTQTGSGDHATWKFFTNDTIDLIPPIMESRTPEHDTQAFDPDMDLHLYFSKIIPPSEDLMPGKSLKLVPVGTDVIGYWIDSIYDYNNLKTDLILKTAGLDELAEYYIEAGSGITDINGNCYKPTADIGNCVSVPVPGQPGQYTEGDPWHGDFPSCDRREPANP